MCLICVEITKDKLTSMEARRNLGEMHYGMTKEHILKVLKLIWKKEDQEEEQCWNELDAYWRASD